MTKSTLSRGVSMLVAVVTATCFGFTGAASAQSAITLTGPNSNNQINNTNNTNCQVTNNNNVSANNNVSQNATSGNVNVSCNTVAGGTLSTGWGAWDPAVWQANGFTFA